MYCAANDGKLSRVPEIARAYGVSELFLFKIIQPLHKAGIMDTVRGRNGGVKLGRPAKEITLFDVSSGYGGEFLHGRMFRGWWRDRLSPGR